MEYTGPHSCKEIKGNATFNLYFKKPACTYKSEDKNIGNHAHPSCEIYIIEEGDVTYEVENKIYNLGPGDVIITRPYEYHRCSYISDGSYKDYWMVFDCGGDEELFEIFFNRELGEDNHIRLTKDSLEQVLGLIKRMHDEVSPIELKVCFFSIIQILENARGKGKKSNSARFTKDVKFAIDYINEFYGEEIFVEDIAKSTFVSVNTLERHFKKQVGLSPIAYLRKTRLLHGAKMLREGEYTETVVAKCGFSDYSYFINAFKKEFGATPFKYSKYFKNR